MYQELQIGKLFPSPLNPRHSVNQKKLEELQGSIEEHGIIEPLVVRKKGARFEIICGSRRFTAAVAANLAEVPVVVRKLTDVAALEMALIENVQDEELHPLDEAAGYAALLKAGAGKATHASIGKKIGKTPAHVFKRCQLLQLSAPVRKAFAADRITEGHADRLTRVASKHQAAALEVCFHPLFREWLVDKGAPTTEPAPVAKLDEWIARHVKEELDEASIVHVFPELLEQTDGDHPEDVIPELIGLSESHHAGSDLQTAKHGLVNAGGWTEIKPGAKQCGNQRQGVVLHGGPVRVLTICAQKGCARHRPMKRKPKPGSAAAKRATTATAKRQAADDRYRADREREEKQRQAWDTLRPKALKAFARHVTSWEITPALVGAAIGDYELGQVRKIMGVQTLTPENMGQALAVGVLITSHTFSQKAFEEAAAAFEFDLARQVDGATSMLPKKKAKKKTAKRRTRKAAKKAKG